MTIIGSMQFRQVRIVPVQEQMAIQVRIRSAALGLTQMERPHVADRHLDLAKSVQQQRAQFPIKVIPFHYRSEISSCPEWRRITILRSVLEGLPIPAQSIGPDMSEETGGLLTMWDCHTTPPQRVDLALDRHLRNWWLRIRLGRSHRQLRKIAKPPWCAVPTRGVGGIVSFKVLFRRHAVKSNVTELRSHKVSWQIRPRNSSGWPASSARPTASHRRTCSDRYPL